MSTKRLYILLSSSVFVLALIASGLWYTYMTTSVLAGHDGTWHDPAPLQGYAWSSTVGWISLNCLTGSTSGGSVCGTSNYRVQVEPSDSSVTGYAWNSNVGWIRFGGLGSPPSAPGNPGGQARIVPGSTGQWKLTGWARACAVFQSGCSGSLRSNTERGDWDGWIALEGTNHRIEFNNNGAVVNASYSATNAPYAWGSDVVGWVNFSGASIFPPCDSSAPVCESDEIIRRNMWCTPVTVEETCEFGCSTGSTCFTVTATDLTAEPRVVRGDNTVEVSGTINGPAGLPTECQLISNDPSHTPKTFSSAIGGTFTFSEISDPVTFNYSVFTVECGVESRTPAPVGEVTVQKAPSTSES